MNDLVKFGADQYVIRVPLVSNIRLILSLRSYALGEETFIRYRNLIESGGLPFVRSTGSNRVFSSAQNWTLGTFHFVGSGLQLEYLFCRILCC